LQPTIAARKLSLPEEREATNSVVFLSSCRCGGTEKFGDTLGRTAVLNLVSETQCDEQRLLTPLNVNQRFSGLRSVIMRRFIISAVAGLSVCLGGAAVSQAATFVKSVTVTKSVVTTQHVVAPRVVVDHGRHIEVMHFGHRFEHGRHR
jgi:hypothetical protein